MPNAMAVDEDGSDYSYFSSVKFGSVGKEMYMLIDTGSANTWVMGSDCTSNACQIHNTFGSVDSTTLNETSQTWSVTYGTGKVQGIVASDTVAFANYSLDMGFGLASAASDDFNNYPMDGILGLGRPDSNALGTPTIMGVLDTQAAMKENIIGIHLQRNADGTKDGQITFGGVDTSKFNGKLGYTSTVDASSWEIAVDDAGVNGTPCNLTGKSAIIDTGTSYILMPQSDADTLHALIPGSSSNGENYLVPCSSTANVHFTFSGTAYSVSPKDYVGKASGNLCNSNIIGHQAFGPNQWILGDVFLKNVYAVFDFDKNRIGESCISASLDTNLILSLQDSGRNRRRRAPPQQPQQPPSRRLRARLRPIPLPKQDRPAWRLRHSKQLRAPRVREQLRLPTPVTAVLSTAAPVHQWRRGVHLIWFCQC